MQGSSRMDTLGCGYNASWSLPGGKETEEDVETYIRLQQECVSGTVVRQDRIGIVTTAGMTNPVPRIEDTTDGTPDGHVHCLLHLHNREPAIVGGVSVSVHWPDSPHPVRG